MLRALSAIALVLAAPVHAELTDFDTQYDYLTTVVRADLSVLTQVVHLQVNSNLTAALLPLLDETEAQIGAGNLTFPIYFKLRDGLFDVANATLSGDDVAKFVAEIDAANEAVDATDMIRVAPLAFGDVTFDLLDTMAKQPGADDFARTFVEERDAYEKLVHVSIGPDRLAAQFDDMFARLRVEDNHMDNRFNTALQELEIDTKKTYGYTEEDNEADKKEDAVWRRDVRHARYLAKTIGPSADNYAKQYRAERKAYEALVDAGASVHRFAAQFNDCFERLRRDGLDIYNVFHTSLVQLEIETKRAYGYPFEKENKDEESD